MDTSGQARPQREKERNELAALVIERTRFSILDNNTKKERALVKVRAYRIVSYRIVRAAIIHGRARRDATRRDACRLSFVGSDSIDPVKEIIAAALRYESVRGNGTTLRAQITRSLC
jgi:hypothetical protein